MTNQEILDNAPDGWTHVRIKYGLPLWYKVSKNNVHYFSFNTWLTTPEISHTTRSRADIERIVELEDEIEGLEDELTSANESIENLMDDLY